MPSTTIRISESSRKMLYDLARQDNKSMQAIMEQAIESYRRQRFLEGLSEDFASLKNNPENWQAEVEERKEWDVALADGETK